MNSFLIRQIGNGWTLKGPGSKTLSSYSTSNEELFLPTINAVADILKTWQLEGFAKAASEAKGKYEWRK